MAQHQERESGKIEAVILSRLQIYREQNDTLQETHYSNLLSDYRLRVAQGLSDAGSYTVNLPPLEFPSDIELAARYRNIIGTLEDGVYVYTAADHFNTHNQGFSVVEKSLASLGFNGAGRAVRRNQDIDLFTKLTLGDIRGLSPADIVASQRISFRRALIFLHGIQSQNPSNP